MGTICADAADLKITANATPRMVEGNDIERISG
jgi:hypothetical protein